MTSKKAAANIQAERQQVQAVKKPDKKTLGAFYGNSETNGTFLGGGTNPALTRSRFLGY